jgi:methyltransferase-like protein
MSNWNAGYITEISYTHGYYGELNPHHLKLPFLFTGYHFPEIKNACELGFGQGLSINIHSAASNVQWYGNDFNPSQAAFAQELASASGSGAKLFDDSFEQFVKRDDLPNFDFIALHGIWSWISEKNRKFIIEFIQKKLNVGGVVYISYNTLPGFSTFAPIRHLMNEYYSRCRASDDLITNVGATLKFSTEFMELNPIFLNANPSISERLKQVTTQNPHYLAHEYLNQYWQPMYFADMARYLDDAKLSYVCSAHYNDLVPAINFTNEQQNFLNKISDPVFKETLKDFMKNAQFRRDYWIKGPRKSSLFDRVEQFKNFRFLLNVNPAFVDYKIKGALGEGNLTEALYSSIIDILSDHQPKIIAQIDAALRSKNIEMSFLQILEVMLLLSAKSYVQICQDDPVIKKVRHQTDRLNSYLINRAKDNGEISFLASPVTGGGVSITRFDQLFLLALRQGNKLPSDMANFVWKILKSQGQLLVKEGKTLENEADNLKELSQQADKLTKQIHILKALQIL